MATMRVVQISRPNGLAAELSKLGGAKVFLATVTSGEATFPLERVTEAYDRMMSGKARFRVVLAIGH